MSLPSSVGLPAECMLGSLDNSLPSNARSQTVKIQPSNISSVSTSFTTPVNATAAPHYMGEIHMAPQQLLFDLPIPSASSFLDNRFTTVNFTATIKCTTAGTGSSTLGLLRGSAASYIDRMTLIGGDGSVLEDINEYGLTTDTILNLQQDTATRHGTALQYGFQTDMDNLNEVNIQEFLGNSGHTWNTFVGIAPNVNQSESHSYSFPLVSGIIGMTADKFINIGRVSRMQLQLTLSDIAPLTIYTDTVVASGSTYTLTLSNFSLQCEYVDVGMESLHLLDETLVNGKAYIHGTTYRTSSMTLPVTTGSTSLLSGIRASSVKSLFTRFQQNCVATNLTTIHGKYDSTLPLLNSINYNVGGTLYPQQKVNPLLFPSQSFRDLQCAVGSFNSAQYASCISASQYCRLSNGGTAQGTVNGVTQEQNWSLPNEYNDFAQCQYIFGQNLEVCCRKSLLSGLNCTSSPIFLEMNIAQQPTYTHTAYVQAMLDCVTVHDIKTGLISVRI